jgi:hypothetical protein
MHVIEQECSHVCFCCLISFKIPTDFLKREMKH